MVDLLIMYVIMAGVFTLGKTAVLSSAPFFLTAVRLVPAGFLFLTGVYFFDRKSFFFKSKFLPTIIGVAFFFFAMDSFRFVGLQYIPSAHAALINSLSPFIAALLATLVFKEAFTLKKLFALCLGFAGVLPLIIENIQGSLVDGLQAQLLGGYAAVFASMISGVLGTFFLKKLLDKGQYSIYMSLGMALFFGGLLSLSLETWTPIPVTDIATVFPIIMFLFVTHNLLSQPLYGYLVRKYPVTLITFATLITPLTACLIGHCFYNQKVGFTFIGAVLSLMVAFYIFYHEEEKEGLIK